MIFYLQHLEQEKEKYVSLPRQVTLLVNQAYAGCGKSDSTRSNRPQLDGACRVSYGGSINVGSRERVLSLHALAAETANWTGTGIDGGASSANGGSAYIHVTAVTGTIEGKKFSMPQLQTFQTLQTW